MSNATAIKRQLTIKTGSVKRLAKEEKAYLQEAVEQEERIKQYERDGKDEWHVKKQREVLQDGLQMIPDCKRRLEAAVTDLQSLLDSLDSEVAASPEAEGAREALAIAAASGSTQDAQVAAAGAAATAGA